MQRRGFLAAAGAVALSACSAPATDTSATRSTASTTTSSRPPAPSPPPTSAAPPTPATDQEVLARWTVPVLCFHQLREFAPDDSAYARTIITPPAVPRAQLQALVDGGRTPLSTPVLPDHLQFGAPLPDRPVLLTFDDGSVTRHWVALPVLTEFGFPGTFFPMTVVLGKPNWLSADQLREMDRAGMTIGARSYDHQRVDRIGGDQYVEQLDEPRADLAEMLGHPVETMAYPNGTWSAEALPRGRGGRLPGGLPARRPAGPDLPDADHPQDHAATHVGRADTARPGGRGLLRGHRAAVGGSSSISSARYCGFRASSRRVMMSCSAAPSSGSAASISPFRMRRASSVSSPTSRAARTASYRACAAGP